MVPKEETIRLVPNDKYGLTIDIVDDNDVIVNLTGETISLKVYSKDTLILTLTSGSGLTVTPLIGRVVLALSAAQTLSLKGKSDLRYVLRLDSPSEQTVLIGRVEVHPNV